MLLKATLDQLILLNHKEEEICRHDICRLKGQKILARDHGRDKQAAIVELMDGFSELMENKLQALNWISQIREHKPRYIRDQIQLLKSTVTGLDPHIASLALNYACQHKIVSATDFKAITVYSWRLDQGIPCASNHRVVYAIKEIAINNQ